jgi:hypothetical protein
MPISLLNRVDATSAPRPWTLWQRFAVGRDLGSHRVGVANKSVKAAAAQINLGSPIVKLSPARGWSTFEGRVKVRRRGAVHLLDDY